MKTPVPISELEKRGPITIASAEAWRVSVPMLEPFRISSGEVSRKDAVLIRLSDGKHFGWGESSAMPGNFYSNETPDTCQEILVKDVLPSVVDRTFESMLELETELARLTDSRFTRVAVETAAWELLARAAGQSLRSFFGLEDRPVPSGLAVGLYPDLDDLRAALDRYGVHDYARLKIKIKRGADLELVRAVRRWFPEIPLFVDANADYSIGDRDLFTELDGYDLMMFEQPFAREAFADSALLQRSVQTPICMDESIETKSDVELAYSSGACRIVNIKLQRIGGFLEALRIMDFCHEHGLPAWMGTMPELGVGSAQALVLATHPACQFPTDVEPSSRWYVGDVLSPALTLSESHLVAPSGDGLGFEVDMFSVAQYQSQHWKFGQ